MPAVNVARLRSRLREYLQRARQGEEILIHDRRRPVAKLVPLAPADLDERLRELAAQGLVRLPRKRMNWKAFFKTPAPRIPSEKLRAALEAEREED